MQKYQLLQHEFPPVFDENSRILILGSFPSVKSREQSFYYGHPQNRFWNVLAAVTEDAAPHTDLEAAGENASQTAAGVSEVTAQRAAVVASGNAVPQTIAEKKDFLLQHRIALWDVIEQCEIIGSSDSSIRNVVPVDISVILNQAPIRRIYANGSKAFELYQKYLFPVTGLACEKLPSTSPANAAYSLERLIKCWEKIRESCERNNRKS